MIDILKLFAALALGYLLGSLNTAVIVGKIYGKDIRSHGSKSAGLTNTLRVLGKSAAVFVLAGDILKGIIACFIGLFLGVYFYSGEANDCVSLLAAGAGAVIGHNWPVYFYIFACLMALMVIFRHMGNIQRLLSGTENKLTF